MVTSWAKFQITFYAGILIGSIEAPARGVGSNQYIFFISGVILSFSARGISVHGL
jgi:hypothetical protein